LFPVDPCRTLIVEDDARSADALHRLLRLEGFEARHVRTVAAASAELASGWARCVVLDLHLPDGCGVDLLRDVRRRGLGLRVVVTTGSGNEALLSEVRQLRPDGLFLKPYRPSQLIEWLQQN
jgi:DNA-binding response OmpR family regulator